MASSRSLSDYNIPGYRSKKVASPVLFSDLNLTMPIHPNKNDIIPLTDIDAVKNAIKNLVLTNFGEKLFKPRVGGNVTSFLFENVDIFTAISIKDEIRDVITKFEPRVDKKTLTIQVDDESDRNAYNVNVGFKIIGAPQDFEVEFELTRTR